MEIGAGLKLIYLGEMKYLILRQDGTEVAMVGYDLSHYQRTVTKEGLTDEEARAIRIWAKAWDNKVTGG